MNILFGKRYRRLDIVHCTVVPRKGARLGEGGQAEFTGEGSHIDVPPVVHDEAGAFSKGLVTVPIFTDEVRREPILILHRQFNLQI